MQYLNDNGHLTDEALSLYAEALKLDQLGQAPDALREHLEQCPQCQEQAMALYALIADQDYSGLGPHPTFGQAQRPATASTLKMWFRPLLLLLMAVLALFFFLQQQRQKDQPPTVEESLPAAPPSMLADSIGASPPLRPPQAKAEPLPEKPVEEGENRKFYPAQERRAKTANQKPPTKDGLLAANFTPSETLDPLVGAVTRSSGLSDIQPPAGAELKIGEAVVFSWQTSVEGPLTLRLLNNREEEIFNRTVESNRLSSPMTLQPGLYYWKLETADDLIYTGKFFVRE